MKDIAIYNERMRKSMMDKLFFFDKVDAEIFVDFGCADGTMIRMMNDIFPEYTYIGFDNAEEMIRLAKLNLHDCPNCHFVSKWEDVISLMQSFNMPEVKRCLVFSSVLHEIEDKELVFDGLNFDQFDYIAIRDMMYEDSNSIKFSLSALYDKIPDNIKAHFGAEIWHPWNMIQAVFKSYYKENIDTEISEDYFSFNQNHLLALQYKHKLTPVYEYHYLLPYWRQTIKKDFGVDLQGVKTHIQVIYEIEK